MQALNEYVAQKNRWNSMFGGKPLSLSNAQDRKAIASSIDADLSPENLSCDGELPASQVRARYRNLSKCAEQLLKLDPSVQIYEFG
jgi:hypothetical protein